ncbi:ParB/RepB/Spo0J family partition protein [Sphaerisporangium sp. NPDC005289]|uniref:ParB/RepB/Spo0J family partition protein n=1 Tax=Sphaerisporangium sp. NPDC005289 TaxID=3155247 RepID=UPI0033BD79C4
MNEVAVSPDIVDVPVADVDIPAAPTSEGEGARGGETVYTERPMIPVDLLVAHPGNVRQDRQASEEFCRSVAAAGIITPLEITVEPDGGYRVVDGNVRLDAALKVGLPAVPYFFSTDTADDEGLQYLHMLITSRFRTSLSVHEEAQALFSAAQAGMTRTQIRRVTGLSSREVKAGVRAGGLGGAAKQLAAGMDYEWTLEELALLKPFEDDPEALEAIHRRWYGPLKYTVQRLLDEREAKARRAKMIAELEQSGITITADLPDGAMPLRRLMNGDQEMDADAHATCPGRGAWLAPWTGASPNHYCLDPVAYGHVFAETGTTNPPPPAEPTPTAQPVKPAVERKIVVEGNKAWAAAATVRQQWLREFLAHKTPPKNVAATIARFVTEQLVTMPEPLCRALAGARHTQVFETFGSPTALNVAKSSQQGLWMIALAPIATAYEREITGDGERRNTWREDKYSPCTRTDAGAWLRFITEIGASHGYEPSPIEKAVADGVPYRGDNPAEDISDETTTEETRSGAVSTAPESHDEHDDPPLDMSEPAPGATGVNARSSYRSSAPDTAAELDAATDSDIAMAEVRSDEADTDDVQAKAA